MAETPPAPSAETSEKTRSHASLADKVGMVVGSQFVTTAVTMVQSILVVRYLGKADYGTLSFVLMLYATGRDLGLLAIPESLLYFFPKVRAQQFRGLVRQSMGVLVGLGAFVGLVLVALGLSPALFLEGRTGLSPLLGILALSTVIGFPASVYGNVFIATGRHRDAASISLLMTFLGAAATLIPAILGLPLVWIVLGHALNMTIRLTLSERLYRKLYADVKREPFPGGLRAQMAYVIPLAVTRFAAIFNQKLDKFTVGLFFSATAFAEFAVGAQELPLVNILPYSVASTMLPQFVEAFEAGATPRDGAREAIKLWHAGIRKVALIMVPLGAFLIVAAEPLMELLYGAPYRNAAAPFRVYTALLPLRVTSYGILLMAFGKTKLLLRSQVIGMLVNTGLAILLLWQLGMIGAPVAAVLTQVFLMIYLVIHIRGVAKLSVRDIFPWGPYGRIALASLVATLPLWGIGLLTDSMIHPAVYLGAGAPLFLISYLSLAAALKVLGPEDKAFVRRWATLEPLRKPKQKGTDGGSEDTPS